MKGEIRAQRYCSGEWRVGDGGGGREERKGRGRGDDFPAGVWRSLLWVGIGGVQL